MLRRAVLAAVLLALAAPDFALADGDPASDLLPTQDAYYPYSPAPAPELVEALDGLLADVREKGYPMKVALIQAEADLGAYPQLFNDPQRYADLLASELPKNPHGNVREALHLLVIMPGGFGGKNLGEGVDRALAPVTIDPGAQSDGLVRAGIEAVARIATENGFDTPVPRIPEAGPASAEDGGGAGTAGLVLAAVALVLLAVGLLAVRLRGRASDARPPGGPDAQEPAEEGRTP